MTPQRAKELLPVIQAFAEGKKIEGKLMDSDVWIAIHDPKWGDDWDYRIKPEPREWWIKLGQGQFGIGAAHSEYTHGSSYQQIHVREVLE